MKTHRRTTNIKSIILVLLLSALTYACRGEQGPAPKIIVVFVDLSASVKDFDGYHDSWKKIVNTVAGGDRVVLGRITDETFTQFRPVMDESLPTFSWISDNSRDYDKKIKDAKERLAKALDESLKAPRSPKTDILNTLALADKIFHGDKRRAILVLLSDMLDDSEAHNFERVKVDETYARHVIETKHRKGEMPDLKEAKIYVAGASAKNASKALEIQRFWLEYFKAANGSLSPQNYGPALVNFDE